jgi:hypothetical protein
MNKGIIVMILAGMGFMYLVTDLVGEAESTTPGLENSQSRKAKEYARYYKKDINGDDMLSLAGVPLPKAKAVWSESTVKYRVLGYFPDFDTMKQIAASQIDESEFKTFLLAQMKKIEGEYLDGVRNLDQTKKAMEDIR